MQQTTSWSEALREYTLASLNHNNDFIPWRDELYFKQIQGGAAVMSLSDFANKVPRLTEPSGTSYLFESIESLVDSGWALD
jgi:hypothetical protein